MIQRAAISIAFVFLIRLPDSSSVGADPQAVSEDVWRQWVEAANQKYKSSIELDHKFFRLGLDSKQALSHCQESLSDHDVRVRLAAVTALRIFGPDAGEAVPALIDLSRKDPECCAACFGALGAIGPAAASAIPTMAAVLRKEKKNRYGIATALGKIGPAAVGATSALIECLGDEFEFARRSAAEALGNCGPDAKEAIPALVAALDDKSPSTRAEVAAALWRICRSDLSLDVLIATLKEDDFTVQLQAITVLGEMGADAKRAVPALEEASRVGSALTRAPIVWALGAIMANRNLTDEVVVYLDDEDPAPRMGAVWALARLGPSVKSVLPKLEHAYYHDPHPFVRLGAADVIRRVDREAYAKMLKE